MNVVAHPSVVSSIFEGLGQPCLILPLKDRQLQELGADANTVRGEPFDRLRVNGV